MMKRIVSFKEFINESAFPNNVDWSEEFVADWNTMQDMVDELKQDGEWEDCPESEAVEAIVKDSGCDPQNISYMGMLDHDNTLVTGGVKVPTPGGYPGAITVSKFEGANGVHYVMNGYDADIVWWCVTR
jgi:hypothetical protein